MKTNIDEPCAGNLQARFFRGSCSNKTQTRGVKLQLLPNNVVFHEFLHCWAKCSSKIATHCFITIICLRMRYISLKNCFYSSKFSLGRFRRNRWGNHAF
ncbi:hypothetical protein [Wolbachia endosymbiont (group A) of Nomada goodeniana]|uniref:hypothetical protein n=1 Tax=Wolbachia endosymbiont (group A) of Nomada goodeniana TaxID=3066207 RepID=UPI00333FB938